MSHIGVSGSGCYRFFCLCETILEKLIFMQPNIKSIHRPFGILILSTALLIVAACDRTSPIRASSKTAQPTGQSATASATYAQFPDIPIPSGATINVEKTLVFGSDPWFGQLSINARTESGILFEFYRANLPQYNWQEIASVRAPTSILTYENADRVLVISIQRSTLRGSELTVSVSPRGKPAPLPRTDVLSAPVQ